LQEGINFGDGEEYNPAEYQRMMASAFTKDYEAKNYREHEHVSEGEEAEDRRRCTPKNLERDYWDIVETQSRDVGVEYGNDIDTNEFGSGFRSAEDASMGLAIRKKSSFRTKVWNKRLLQGVVVEYKQYSLGARKCPSPC
jgi:hypothetical protein